MKTFGKGLGFSILLWNMRCIVQTHAITYPLLAPKPPKKGSSHNNAWIELSYWLHDIFISKKNYPFLI